MKYQIWDKVSNIITPSGEVFTPEQWMEMYPLAKMPDIDLVISAGKINGAFCGELTSLIEMFDRRMKSSAIEKYQNGIDDNMEPQEILDFIGEFEDDMISMQAEEQQSQTNINERIAAALEAQVMMLMPDVE